MGFLRNVKTSIDDKSSFSVNNITVLASAVMGIIIGFVICFVLVYDVTYDGKVDTNLTDLGIFLLCGGGYILSSGAPKAFVDSKMRTRSWVEGEKMQIDADEEIREYRRRRNKEEDLYGADEGKTKEDE